MYFTVVLQAANGRLAIDSLQILQVVPDICILDINMPEMDGFDTARELKQRYSQIKILVLSSLDHKKFITKMLDLGVKGYILKGYASEELKTAVMKLYKGGYYFSETVNSTAVSYLAGNNKF